MARDLLLITIGPPPPALVKGVLATADGEVELALQSAPADLFGNVQLTYYRAGLINWDRVNALFGR